MAPTGTSVCMAKAVATTELPMFLNIVGWLTMIACTFVTVNLFIEHFEMSVYYYYYYYLYSVQLGCDNYQNLLKSTENLLKTKLNPNLTLTVTLNPNPKPYKTRSLTYTVIITEFAVVFCRFW